MFLHRELVAGCNRLRPVEKAASRFTLVSVDISFLSLYDSK